MNINDIINARIRTPGSECEVIDKVEVAQTVLQETEPYSITKSITGTNIYVWNKKFIDKVIESFATTIVQNFSKKEKDLFNRYASFIINGIVGVLDEDVRELDIYIGTIKWDYLWIVL